MFQLFHALAERVKALFVTDAALEMEAEFLARQAARKAELLRCADRYEHEGLHGIAQHLRQQVEDVNLQRPLASVLPSITHLLDKSNSAPLPLLQDDPTPTDVTPTQSPPARKKKGR